MRAFVDLSVRSNAGMSAAWRTRFALDISKYLFSYYLEAVNRSCDRRAAVERVIEIRRDAIAIRPSLTFGETVNGLELASPIVTSELFHRIRMICADIVVLQNDYYSIFKDLDNGELSNQAVTLVRGPTTPLLRQWHICNRRTIGLFPTIRTWRPLPGLRRIASACQSSGLGS